MPASSTPCGFLKRQATRSTRSAAAPATATPPPSAEYSNKPPDCRPAATARHTDSATARETEREAHTAAFHRAIPGAARNTQLEKQLAGQPQKTQDEIIRINTEARHVSLQIALLIPILAGLAGLGVSFRMVRLPDPEQSGTAEQMVLG